MSKRARPPELEGIGVDGLPYQVKQDGKATKSGRKYRIFFGPGLRGAIRFPPGQELTHENTITAPLHYWRADVMLTTAGEAPTSRT